MKIQQHKLIKLLLVVSLTIGMIGVVDAESGVLELKWKHTMTAGIGSVSAADILGNENKEVVIGGDIIYVFNMEGDLEWAYNTKIAISQVHITDMDLDGSMEVIAGSGEYGRYNYVWVLNASGHREWEYRLYDRVTTLNLVDLDLDGHKEVIFGSGVGDRSIYVLDENGSLEWRFPINTTIWSVCTSDIDNDGHEEVLVGSSNSAYLFDIDGTLKWIYPANSTVRSCYIADLDDDGDNEVILGSYNYITVLDAKKTVEWKQKIDGVIWSICASDLDRDGHKEVVVGASDNVYVLDKDGGVEWEYNTGNEVNLVRTSDLDQNGHKEVVVGSSNVYVLDNNGSLEWIYNISGEPSALYISDLDDDGYEEIIAGFSGEYRGKSTGDVYVLMIKYQDKKQEADSYYDSSRYYYESKEYIKAFNRVQRAKELYLGLNDTVGIFNCEVLIKNSMMYTEANSHYENASEYYNSSDYENSIIHASKARELYLELNDTDEIPKCDLLISAINEKNKEQADYSYDQSKEYFVSNDYENAKKYAIAAKEIYSGLGDTEGISNCEVLIENSKRYIEANSNYKLAQNYYKSEDYENALIHAEIAKDIYSTLNDSVMVSNVTLLISEMEDGNDFRDYIPMGILVLVILVIVLYLYKRRKSNEAWRRRYEMDGAIE